MKLAFPACGYSSQNYKDIFSLAKDSGFDALEFRINKEDINDSDSQISILGELAVPLDIQIACLTSNNCFIDNNKEYYNNKTVIDYIDFAKSLKIPYIQFKCDPNTCPQMDIDLDLLVDNLSLAATYADKNDVMLLIETNGAFSDSHLLKDLLKIIANPRLGILWNVHNPYRFCLETIAETYETLNNYVKYVHLSDSLMGDNGPEYCLLGNGDIPNQEAILTLKEHNFKGYVSWGNINLIKSNIQPKLILNHFINYIKTSN